MCLNDLIQKLFSLVEESNSIKEKTQSIYSFFVKLNSSSLGFENRDPVSEIAGI